VGPTRNLPLSNQCDHSDDVIIFSKYAKNKNKNNDYLTLYTCLNSLGRFHDFTVRSSLSLQADVETLLIIDVFLNLSVQTIVRTTRPRLGLKRTSQDNLRNIGVYKESFRSQPLEGIAK